MDTKESNDIIKYFELWDGLIIRLENIREVYKETEESSGTYFLVIQKKGALVPYRYNFGTDMLNRDHKYTQIKNLLIS